MNPAHPVIPGRLLGYWGRLTDDVAAACGGRLRAAYLHGSGALGGWIPGRSDVDILFVADDDVTGQPLGAVGEVLGAAGSQCPGRYLECSVVTISAARAPQSPWPFLLHVVAGHEPDQLPGRRSSHWPAGLATDRIVHQQVAVPSQPAVDYLGRCRLVTRAMILGYLADEMDWGLANAPEAYTVLNACRAMIFLTDDAIVSKIAGGETALERGAGPASVIRRALGQQRGERADQPPADDAASYVLTAAAALRRAVS